MKVFDQGRAKSSAFAKVRAIPSCSSCSLPLALPARVAALVLLVTGSLILLWSFSRDSLSKWSAGRMLIAITKLATEPREDFFAYGPVFRSIL